MQYGNPTFRRYCSCALICLGLVSGFTSLSGEAQNFQRTSPQHSGEQHWAQFNKKDFVEAINADREQDAMALFEEASNRNNPSRTDKFHRELSLITELLTDDSLGRDKEKIHTALWKRYSAMRSKAELNRLGHAELYQMAQFEGIVLGDQNASMELLQRILKDDFSEEELSDTSRFKSRRKAITFEKGDPKQSAARDLEKILLKKDRINRRLEAARALREAEAKRESVVEG